jgi:23S rRNA maturation mini-RNase III
MNILSDKCIKNLVEFLEEKNNSNNNQSDTEKINYKSYKFDDVELISEMGHKLSNQEKNIIKRIRNKEIKI